MMMVMGKEGYDKICWQICFGKNPLQVFSGNGGVCPHGETFFFEPRRPICQYQIGVNRDAKLCYWVCMLG